MKPDILTKLAHALAQPVTSEGQVVYIMVELRKLIELNGDGAMFAALKFHCDWVAHPVLQGLQAQEIVRLFDRYQKLEDNKPLAHGRPDMSFMNQLGPVLTMSDFRNEVDAYLRSQQLDSSIPNGNDKWATFLMHYAGVIEDCPLRCVSQGLKHVDEVTLKLLGIPPKATASSGFQLVIEWRWKSKLTGKEFTNQQQY